VSRFVLRPCKIREDRVVVTEKDPLVLNARELVTKFSPRRLQRELMALKNARLNSFIGLCKGSRSGQTVPFIIWNQDRSNKIRWLLKRDAAFPDRLLEIYRLEEIDWGSRFDEPVSGEVDRIPGNRARPRARMTEG
jgi:hypothetical protein